MGCTKCGNRAASGKYCGECGEIVQNSLSPATSDVSRYELDLEVKSEPIIVEFDSDWTSHWESSSEFFSHQYFGAGGSTICLNPDLDSKDLAPFENLEADEQPETVVVEADSDGTEILATTGTAQEGWEFTYRVVCTLAVEVRARDLESAKTEAHDAAKRLFMIYDRSSQEPLDIEQISCKESFSAAISIAKNPQTHEQALFELATRFSQDTRGWEGLGNLIRKNPNVSERTLLVIADAYPEGENQ